MTAPITSTALRELAAVERMGEGCPASKWELKLADYLDSAADQIERLEKERDVQWGTAAALRDTLREKERRIGDLTEALRTAIDIAEDHIHSEYDGTGLLNGLLGQLDSCRAVLAKGAP